MIKVQTFKNAKTGETVVTEQVNHPKFWGRLISAKEKSKHIRNGTLTLAQTKPLSDTIEEPLTAPSMDDKPLPLELNAKPRLSFQVISRMSSELIINKTEEPLIMPEVFEEKKSEDAEAPLEMPSVWDDDS